MHLYHYCVKVAPKNNSYCKNEKTLVRNLRNKQRFHNEIVLRFWIAERFKIMIKIIILITIII